MYFEPCLQLPRENENSESGVSIAHVYFAFDTPYHPHSYEASSSQTLGVSRSVTSRGSGSHLHEGFSGRSARAALRLSSFFADAEDITSGPALVRERGGLVPTDVCVRTDEGFRALCRRSLGSLLPKLFSAGLPNPSWTAAKLAAYLKQQVGLQCAVTPVRV